MHLSLNNVSQRLLQIPITGNTDCCIALFCSSSCVVTAPEADGVEVSISTLIGGKEKEAEDHTYFHKVN